MAPRHPVVLSLKQWLVLGLTSLLTWLDPPKPPDPYAGDLNPYAEAAIPLVLEWEERLGTGYGDAKRAQVYSRLQKRFPGVSKRILSRAIEDALDAVEGVTRG